MHIQLSIWWHSLYIVRLFVQLSNLSQIFSAMAPFYYKLQELSVNPNELSVTSFAFMQSKLPPVWVDHLLGSQALYWNQTMLRKGIAKAKQNFIEGTNIRLAEYALRPLCYIEMLGFVRLGRQRPFLGLKDRFRRPSTGTAVLKSTTGNNINWECYYRAVYNNWPRVDFNSTYWAVPFYCPAKLSLSSRSACENFVRQYQPGDTDSRQVVRYHLTMQLENAKWQSELATHFVPQHAPTSDHVGLTEVISGPGPVPGPVPGLIEEDTGAARGTIQDVRSIAVCTAWPYSTVRDDKVQSNQAMIFEFLRYYTALGMKVFVYDRDGANIRGVFDSAYSHVHFNLNPNSNLKLSEGDMSRINSRQQIERIMRNVVYRNYTIQSLLLPLANERSDMEVITWSQEVLTDHDKMLSYAQCRFEAKAAFGIHQAIVVDFDEFLYCKAAKSDPSSQAVFMQQYLESMRAEGKDQIMVGKTTVASRAAAFGMTMLDCVNTEIDKNKKERAISNSLGNNRSEIGLLEAGSLFNCFGSIDHVIDIPNVKSIHLNHGCPFCGLHYACAPCFDPPGKQHISGRSSSNKRNKRAANSCRPDQRNYKFSDCMCDTVRDLNACDVVHLSIVESKYHRGEKSLVSVSVAIDDALHTSNSIDPAARRTGKGTAASAIEAFESGAASSMRRSELWVVANAGISRPPDS